MLSQDEVHILQYNYNHNQRIHTDKVLLPVMVEAANLILENTESTRLKRASRSFLILVEEYRSLGSRVQSIAHRTEDHNAIVCAFVNLLFDTRNPHKTLTSKHKMKAKYILDF